MNPVYFHGLLLILSLMAVLWLISVFLKNVSIVDLFWGLGFVMVNASYFYYSEVFSLRQILVLMLVAVWGIRLSFYLAWRNIGKGEDFRYQEFRKKYGAKNYWWISFFQVFLLQGVLIWVISSTLWGINLLSTGPALNFLDYLGIFIWIIGFIFEAGGDYQLAKFRAKSSNKGKVLKTGLWRYTRHPNYFGDAAIWWGYGILCISAGGYRYVAGSLIMTLLIIKVSGVALLEKSLTTQKRGYKDYIEKTSPFLPWFPKK